MNDGSQPSPNPSTSHPQANETRVIRGGVHSTVDSWVSSKNPWLILLGTTLGTPVLTTLLLARGMRRNGESVSSTVVGIVFAAATVVGLFIGLTAIGYQRYKNLRMAGQPAPWVLRLLFDGQPMKTIFIGVPLLFILAILAGVLMA